MKAENRKLYTYGMVVLASLIIICLPTFIVLLINRDASMIGSTMSISLMLFAPWFLLFYLNFFLLVPRFYARSRKWVFWLVNLLILLPRAGNLLFVGVVNYLPEVARMGFYTVVVMAIVMDVMIIFYAMGLRYMMHQRDMEVQRHEERRKSAEAELTLLKSQLNPHFLFNTLNNISSLVEVDSGQAQESIGELSDMLRYALYESNQEQVPLTGEVEFMQNYIDLMRLRCNDLAEIRADFRLPEKPQTVAPMLFISLIENAFKHGVNSRKPSFVHISLSAGDGLIVFTCANSYFADFGTDHVGSGIGLENLRRRLQLIYPEAHTYEQRIEDGVYSVNVTIRN